MKKMFLALLFLSSLSAAEDLDSIALRCGTDKSSSFHNYTKTYASYFEPLRDQPIRFLEIGIWKGYSVRMWEEYFSQAELHFIDLNSSTIEYFSPRSYYHMLDQGNVEMLREFGHSSGGGFDIIIDDGGHLPHLQMASFKALFPYMKSGGIYVIEDLHTSYWPGWGGGDSFKEPTIVNFAFSLIDDMNYAGAVTGCANKEGISEELTSSLSEFQSHIASIHFYSSLCIIIRK